VADAPAAGASAAAAEAPVEEESAGPVDLRRWLDDDCTKVCMNPTCEQEFSLMKRRTHCRHCGEIFCSKCTSQKIGKEKVCNPCFELRTKAADQESLPPLLVRPKVKTPLRNFHQYQVSLHDSELFAAAGAGAAASKAALKGAEGKFLLVLTHRRSTRPQLTVAFPTKDERDQWMSLLRSASYWSPAPITNDPILRQAFTRAYQRTRWHCWLWGGWWIDGTEGELISDTLYDVMEREIFGAELGRMGPMPRKLAKSAITKMIEGAVSAAWAGLMKGLEPVRTPLEKAVAEMLDPLFEGEVKFKNQLKAPIMEGAQKGLEAAESKLQEAFESSLPVIAAAGESELNLIHSSLVEVLTESAGDQKRFHNLYWWMKWRNDWQYSFKNRPISEMIDAKLRTSESSSESRELAGHLITDMRNLNQSAFTVLQTAFKKEADPARVVVEMFPDIIQRAAHDINVILTLRLIQALDGTLRPGLMQAMGAIIKPLVSPLEDAIPDLLKDILDPERTCMEILNDVLTDTEKLLIAKCLAPTHAAIVKQAQALAQQGLAK
jgi:hypothetical protein